ncbi:MAG TPA: hypothetical protein VMU69_22635 [Bradyrhizobium sp.]|nr:hypothetical protein [Bradyrhizobium sp.]
MIGITRGLAGTIKTIAADYGALVDDQDIASTAFSDSIVISVPEPVDRNKTGCLYAMAFAVQGLCRQLLVDLGVLTRGGIARGPAYHKDGSLFGRAIIDAYKLERDVAKVARIVVDQTVARHWADTFGNPRGLVALKDVIRHDHDGVPILDLFHFPERDSIDKGTADFFWKAGPTLGRLLADKSLDTRALMKIAWIADHYNHASMLKRLPRCVPVAIPAGLRLRGA